MKGFLSLDPDDATHARLLETQGRLRDVLTRQGVHFPESARLVPILLAWPFATLEEIEAATLADVEIEPRLGGLRARPNDDRPAEIGHDLLGVETLQALLYRHLRGLLDPDTPKAAFVRLARIAPPSRKVGAALHGSGLIRHETMPFRAKAWSFWRQTPTGFEPCRTIPFANGGS